jgi:microcystin degradation protein MlrC
MRIALAGFQHETNTFASSHAGLPEFQMADSWPPLLVGAEVLTQTLGMNLPIAGAAEAAQNAALCPLLWCAAEPSGPVTQEAFETVTAMLIDGLDAAGPIDGLYLDLHGAMVTAQHPSGEVALLRRLRARLGDLPIAVSLDLHANIAPELVALADLITIYRTYPHLDMAATGARAMQGLIQMIRGAKPAKAIRQAPLLIPLHAQFTGAAPAEALYTAVAAQDRSALQFADLALGFTAADVPNCGPALLSYAPTRPEAEAVADALLDTLLQSASRFDTRLLTPETAVTRAMAQPGPVVIADVQDNPGAGGTSDTVGLARALLAAGAGPAVLGVMADPQNRRFGASLRRRRGLSSGAGGPVGLAGRGSAGAGSKGHTPQ